MIAHLPPRALVVDVIRSAADALTSSPLARLNDDAVSRALAAACARAGLSALAFDEAIAQDPDLAHLKTAALHEALAARPDPGPYAAISRESPSGQPGDTTKSRTYPEPDPSLTAAAPEKPGSRP